MKRARPGGQLDTTHWVWGHHLDTFCLLADVWPGIILQAGLTGATQWKEVCCTTKWDTQWRGKLCELVTELHQGQKRPEAEVGFTASAGNTATRGRFLHSMDSEQINAHCTAPLRPTPPPTPPKPILVANDNQTLAVIISRKFWDIVIVKQNSRSYHQAIVKTTMSYHVAVISLNKINVNINKLWLRNPQRPESHQGHPTYDNRLQNENQWQKWYMIQYMEGMK